MPTVMTALATVLAGPAVLLGTAFPGFGTLSDDVTVPVPVVRAAAEADVVPQTGGRVMFNDPSGTRSEQYALVREINGAIDAADPGATVRLAAYSFAMPATARALLRAHERGVRVRVVTDDHSGHWGSVTMLRRALGSDPDADSYVRVCRLSCRGGRGNQHAKFVTVSAGRQGDHRVLVGSVNLTNYSARRQWNDLYVVSDPGLHDQLARTFELMAADRPQARLELPETSDGFVAHVAPYRGVGPDPVAARLGRLRCHGAGLLAGQHGRTVVRIAMHAWNGERGVTLARKVARLARSGCDVRVLYGVGMGRRVATILRNADVPIRDSAHAGDRVHHKVLVVSGRVGRQRIANYVWTGSHNWSDRSMRNDELTVRIAGPELVGDYLRNFRTIWRVAGRGTAR
jgi:phosphatidylserine/phosphatidylglycerophosphate/cardiolipin synthase-like enzyme